MNASCRGMSGADGRRVLSGNGLYEKSGHVLPSGLVAESHEVTVVIIDSVATGQDSHRGPFYRGIARISGNETHACQFVVIIGISDDRGGVVGHAAEPCGDELGELGFPWAKRIPLTEGLKNMAGGLGKGRRDGHLFCVGEWIGGVDPGLKKAEGWMQGASGKLESFVHVPEDEGQGCGDVDGTCFAEQ